MYDENEFEDIILSYYFNNDWQSILNFDIDDFCKESKRRLMWAWPSEQDLKFISEFCQKRNLNGIVSIGCGRGLFEWLLNKCTNLSVKGIEVNECWWKSKYSGPKFIPLHFPKSPHESLFRRDDALLFCYFNNGKAFKEYISEHKGNLIFIIGPQKGKGIYTNPDPLNPNFEDSNWKMIDFRELTNGNDIITVFEKTQ